MQAPLTRGQGKFQKAPASLPTPSPPWARCWHVSFCLLTPFPSPSVAGRWSVLILQAGFGSDAELFHVLYLPDAPPQLNPLSCLSLQLMLFSQQNAQANALNSNLYYYYFSLRLTASVPTKGPPHLIWKYSGLALCRRLPLKPRQSETISLPLRLFSIKLGLPQIREPDLSWTS